MGVVTISRQYGAGGLRVGRALAEALEYTLVDREIVEMAARQAGVDPEVAGQLDERAPALIEKVGLALAAASPEFGLGHPPPLDDRTLAEEVRRVMLSLAATGGYVLLGRGGQAALRDDPDACHLQLVADPEDRARLVADSQGLTIEDARERCPRVDEERAAYVRRFYGVDISDPLLYDAVLNTSRLGMDGSVDAAVQVVRSHSSERADGPFNPAR